MEFDHNNLVVRASVSGIWIGQLLGPGELVIAGQSIEQRTFVVETEQWNAVRQGDEESLKDILEFELNDEFAKLRGFGTESGYWCEIGVSLPKVCFALR
ncbi:MAG: hypothetical protein H6824_08855 [Planctomycetaceae bacterium]|nr:hypothetical protein [Planctomycetaceae bacterium]